MGMRYSRNNFMQVEQERNPYLQRACSATPHKYGFKIEKGSHYLLLQDGTEKPISKIGTFRPKFRQYVTGSATPKQRVLASHNDPTALHFTPSSSYRKQNSFYTPVTRKYLGYAQQPYCLKGAKQSEYLDEPRDQRSSMEQIMLRKCFSHDKKTPKASRHHKNASLIFEHAAGTFVGKSPSDQFYERSFTNQTNQKSLPNQLKKTCYNYRCKYLKFFTFDEREKTKANIWSQTGSTHASGEEAMRSKSFYDRQLELERKEMKTLKSTGVE